MAEPDRILVASVRQALAGVADPVRAPAMAAYMKSAMPFRGIPAPVRRAALRPVFGAHPITDRAVWLATVRALYDDARFR